MPDARGVDGSDLAVSGKSSLALVLNLSSSVR